MARMTDFKTACASYGSNAPYCYKYLFGWSNGAQWWSYDFHIISKMVLSCFQILQWQIRLADEAHEKVRQLELNGNPGNVTYEMLTGIGRWASTDNLLHNQCSAALPHVRHGRLDENRHLI